MDMIITCSHQKRLRRLYRHQKKGKILKDKFHKVFNLSSFLLTNNNRYEYNPVFDSYEIKKSLYPLILLGFSDFLRRFGI